ncbi:MAG: YaaL family protein [Bacillota bacterium]
MGNAEKPEELNFGVNSVSVFAPVSLVKAVEDARQDWLLAKKIFEEATDIDLIDYAIHQIEAAERRYMFLLKKSREEGVLGEVSLR